jgi:hypothetical protein
MVTHLHETAHDVPSDAVAAANVRLRTLHRESEALRSRLIYIDNEDGALRAVLALQTLPKRKELRPCSQCKRLTRDTMGTRALCASHTETLGNAKAKSMYDDLLGDS